ncbi:hypothetical protein BDN70DRAFT_994228 [Pholiota conissans]|uniref:Cyclin N-terminal domain-containing protein n=1 Tax=Pholiota conissans TaxID=109636 RepID=A0A9P5YZ29_9AGAR|nr:hypothetical protein BDN70DRAFT_994228 [Pholiota conissans]
MCAIIKPSSGLSDEYAHIIIEGTQKRGKVQLATFAEVCATRITSHFEIGEYAEGTEESWNDIVSTYIYNIVYESNIGLFATIAALSLIERYQDILTKTDECVVYEVEGICRLFLAAYMAAVKLMHDEQPHMPYWMLVTDNEYSHAELIVAEMQFLDALEWTVTIDSKRYMAIYEETMETYHKLESDLDIAWVMRRGREEFSRSDSSNTFRQIPMLDEEDEELFEELYMRTMESPSARRFEPNPKPHRGFFHRTWRSLKRS